MELIQNWLDSFHFSKYEMYLLKDCRDVEEDNSLHRHERETERLLGFIPCPNFKNREVSLWYNATGLINNLFDRYVDNDTVVITTGSEHGSVRNALQKCQNVLYPIVHGKIVDLSCVENAAKHFKKAFIYTIALSVGDEHYLCNDDVMLIQNILKENGVEFVSVLDAVQEMFLLPRDYSIYDYVVNTAHALLPNYNLGMVFGTYKLGFRSGSALSQYCDLLEILFTEKDKYYLLNNIMRQHFAKYVKGDKDLKDTSQAPFVYNLVDYKKRFAGMNDIEVEKGAREPDYTPVTFRACQFLIQQDKFLDKIRAMDYILESQY